MNSDYFFTIKQFLTNKRLRQDIKALKAAKKCYTYFAWELLDEMNITKIIKNNPKSLEEIQKSLEIKDIDFLEKILDFLVGENILHFTSNKYKLLKTPQKIDKELEYLTKTCPGSTEWTNWLRKESKVTLKTARKIKDSSFDANKGSELWAKVMNESPFALRQLTIDQISQKFKNNNKIIDIGCGDGIGLEDILLRSSEPIQLVGLEVSKNYLNKAKHRINNLEKEFLGIKKENCKKTKFLIQDLTKTNINEKFDALFLSLVINHIPENKRKTFFLNIKKSMKEDSTLVTFQFLNDSKFKRSPMWIMQAIPSHVDFPYREEYISMLKSIFPSVKTLFNGLIIICKLTK